MQRWSRHPGSKALEATSLDQKVKLLLRKYLRHLCCRAMLPKADPKRHHGDSGQSRRGCPHRDKKLLMMLMPGLVGRKEQSLHWPFGAL